MMRPIIISAIAMLAAMPLTGCSDKDDKPTGVIPAYQQKALEQAHATEQVLEDAAEQQRKQLEAAGG